MSLVEFLLARIAEDEAVVERFAEQYGPLHTECDPALDVDDHYAVVLVSAERVFAECGAKRQQLALLDATNDDGIPILTLRLRDLLPRLLAIPYADHPDYRAEWRP